MAPKERGRVEYLPELYVVFFVDFLASYPIRRRDRHAIFGRGEFFAENWTGGGTDSIEAFQASPPRSTNHG
jgi:hypothetical protein